MAVKMSRSRQTTVIQRALLPAFLVPLLLLQIQKPLRQALVLLLRVFQVVLVLVLGLLVGLKVQVQVLGQVPAVQEVVQEVVQEAGLIQVLQEAQAHQETPVLQVLRPALVPQRARILPLLVRQVVRVVQEPLHREHWESHHQIALVLLLRVRRSPLLNVVRATQNRRVAQELLPQAQAIRLQVLPGQAAQLILLPGTSNSLT